jgi:hypothetical protein
MASPRIGTVALVLGLLASSACELVADFDRSKIPTAGSGARAGTGGPAPSEPDASPGDEPDAETDDDAGAGDDAGN